MTWDELTEKAKQTGYLLMQDDYTICQELCQIQKIFYYRDGVINVTHYDKSCIVADHRTPDQMYAIMEALK